jgi:sugar lactone lactonase YvrE
MPTPEDQIHAYARLLDEAVAAVPADEALMADAVPVHEPTRFRLRVVAFAAVVTVAAGIAGAVIVLTRHNPATESQVPTSAPLVEPTSTPTTTSPPRVHPIHTDDTHVPPGVTDIAVSGGAVWVTGPDAVTRLDAVSDRAIATVAAPGVDDYSKIAIGEDSVWVTADGGNVYRVDPATNQVLATIHVGGSASGIAIEAGRVWVTPLTVTGDLTRIDPASNKVITQPAIRVPSGAGAVTAGLGAIWVAGGNADPPSVARVDPATGRVAAVPIVGSVTAAYGSLWNIWGDVVRRYDPQTFKLLASVPVPRAQSIAVTADAVWVLAAPRSSNPTLSYPIKGTAALWEIDPRTNRIVGEASQLDALQPIAITANNDSIWVVDYYSGVITRFREVR